MVFTKEDRVVIKFLPQNKSYYRGVGSSLKLGGAEGNSGSLPCLLSAGIQGAPPEADGILVPEHTFLRCPGAFSASRSDRSDRAEAYI